jgi:hypothetical protein
MDEHDLCFMRTFCVLLGKETQWTSLALLTENVTLWSSVFIVAQHSLPINTWPTVSGVKQNRLRNVVRPVMIFRFC